ncbi:MAG: hypothetical protein IKR18_09755 [Bacteroidaceae bacterium]|nr:hypothetical protein [Bacteroidaceae bacterium]
MKKLLFLILAVVLILTTVSCGKRYHVEEFEPIATDVPTATPSKAMSDEPAGGEVEEKPLSTEEIVERGLAEGLKGRLYINTENTETGDGNLLDVELWYDGDYGYMVGSVERETEDGTEEWEIEEYLAVGDKSVLYSRNDEVWSAREVDSDTEILSRTGVQFADCERTDTIDAIVVTGSISLSGISNFISTYLPVYIQGTTFEATFEDKEPFRLRRMAIHIDAAVDDKTDIREFIFEFTPEEKSVIIPEEALNSSIQYLREIQPVEAGEEDVINLEIELNGKVVSVPLNLAIDNENKTGSAIFGGEQLVFSFSDSGIPSSETDLKNITGELPQGDEYLSLQTDDGKPIIFSVTATEAVGVIDVRGETYLKAEVTGTKDNILTAITSCFK